MVENINVLEIGEPVALSFWRTGPNFRLIKHAILEMPVLNP